MRKSKAHEAGLLNRPSTWSLRSPQTLPGLGVDGETVSWDASLRECGKVSRELEGESTEEEQECFESCNGEREEC